MKYFMNDFFDDRLFNEIAGLRNRKTSTSIYPQCNISKNDLGSFTFNLFVPGFSRNDFEIDVKDNILTVKGKLNESPNVKYLLQEFSQYKSFERSWALPKDVNVDSINASYEAGILVISVPLLEERKPESKQITVQ